MTANVELSQRTVRPLCFYSSPAGFMSARTHEHARARRRGERCKLQSDQPIYTPNVRNPGTVCNATHGDKLAALRRNVRHPRNAHPDRTVCLGFCACV